MFDLNLPSLDALICGVE